MLNITIFLGQNSTYIMQASLDKLMLLNLKLEKWFLALHSTLHSGASVEIQRAILILHLSDFLPHSWYVLSFEVWGTKGNETPHCSLKYYCFIQKHNLESTFPIVATFRNVFTQPFCIAKKGESNVITMFSRWTKRFIRDVTHQKSGDDELAS